MEPSQFVSVVPKYPDKMGFDEVGKVSVLVSTCMCEHVYIMFVCLYQNNKPGHMSKSQPNQVGCWKETWKRFSVFVVRYYSLIFKKEHHGKSELIIESERCY